jgi:hypothetical protein
MLFIYNALALVLATTSIQAQLEKPTQIDSMDQEVIKTDLEKNEQAMFFDSK